MPTLPRFHNLILLTVLLVPSFVGLRAEPSDADALRSANLERAWAEYRFQSFEVAGSFFDKVLTASPTTREKIQATVGLAMIEQFSESSPNPEKAERLYETALQMGARGETRQLIRRFQADLYLADGREAMAVEILEDLVANHIDTVMGQDALLRLTILTMGEFGSEDSRRAARAAEEALKGIEADRNRPMLIPLLSGLIGDIYFKLGEIERALFHFERYVNIGDAGINSYGKHASQLYRIAKLYETEMGDLEKAGRFYRRLVEETPNSPMSFYALEQAVRLKAMSRSDVERLRLGGMTDEVLDELFENVEEQEGR